MTQGMFKLTITKDHALPLQGLKCLKQAAQ
jgi:hypothetical protein